MSISFSSAVGVLNPFYCDHSRYEGQSGHTLTTEQHLILVASGFFASYATVSIVWGVATVYGLSALMKYRCTRYTPRASPLPSAPPLEGERDDDPASPPHQSTQGTSTLFFFLSALSGYILGSSVAGNQPARAGISRGRSRMHMRSHVESRPLSQRHVRPIYPLRESGRRQDRRGRRHETIFRVS